MNASPTHDDPLTGWKRGPTPGEPRGRQLTRPGRLPAGNISSAYRKPDTCRQRHAALTENVSYSEPASANLNQLGLLPLAIIRFARLSVRIVGFRTAQA